MPPAEQVALAGLIVMLAYTVFGLTGFGAAVVGVPMLAQLYPLRLIVPSMLVFDLCTGLLLGLRNRGAVDRSELRRLLPAIIVGMLFGVTALVHAPERWLMLVLGFFVLAYATWGLAAKGTPAPVSSRWSVPAGIGGGAFTALYGTGGPVYTLYLARRLNDKTQLRATVGVLIFGTAMLRLLLFSGTGLLLHEAVLRLALTLLPFAVAGYFIGSRLHGVLRPVATARAVWALLIASGASLVVRGWHAG